MDYKKLITYCLFFFLIFSKSMIAQSKNNGRVLKTFFKNGLIAKEIYSGIDEKYDSIKTYHITGGLDERFYFTMNNRIDGLCEKFSSEGKLQTTWIFKNGVLINRTDNFKEFNAKNKETAEYNYDNIVKTNLQLKTDPNNLGLIWSRASSRIYLKDNILAEMDFLMLKSQLEIIKSIPSEAIKYPRINQDLAEIYSRLASLYSRFENDNLAVDYQLKAVQTDPDEIRHVLNLGGTLASETHEYRLAIYYLNQVISKVPNHNFANWALGAAYLEMEQYQKAADCINLAFENEANLYIYGYGTSENDLRTIRGLAYHKLGKTALGIKDLKEALRINDKNSVANKYFGIVNDDLGDSQKACEYFQKSRELGYEKKYYNKSLESYIKKACKENASKITDSKSILNISPKDLPYIGPNPAENFVEVFNYPYSNFSYDINDMGGKSVGHGIANNKTIQVSGIPSGLYILTIEKEGKQETFKLIKK